MQKMDEHSFKVLHIIDHLTPASGVASVVMLCVTVITELTQDVAVYGQCDAKMEDTVIAHGGKVHKLPDVTQSLGIPFCKAFSKLLHENQYTAIHGHLLNSAFIYMREAKRHGVPLRIIHSHNAVSAETALKRFRNYFLNLGIPLWANKFIAVSDGAAKCAFGKSRKTMAEVKIIFNGIDTDRFRYNTTVRVDMRRELGLAEDSICVGHVGRFAEQKNHAFLLDIFQNMLKKANCVLLLAGEGHLEGVIKAKAHEMGISESIIFLGSRSDAERIYQAFDVFILPSLFEGFPLVAIEAQCAGLGCVVPDYLPRAVECSDNVCFLPLGDAQAWSDTAFELAKIARSDASDRVRAAGLDISDMCLKIAEMYQI
jgi:glycosyltransferase involved in cell wall biosynthesis